MPLNALQVKRAEPQSKDYWLADERGLRLLVKPNGAKYWRMKYRYAGKQKTLALGTYPEVSLKDARLARDKAKLLLADNLDPVQERQAAKAKAELEAGLKFSTVALEWWTNQKGTWTDDHANRVWIRLKDNCFRQMDAKGMEQIRPQEVMAVIRKIEERGALDVASRVLQDIRRVYSFGIQMGHLTFNPALDLTGVLKARKPQHRASLPPEELGQFLVDLRTYSSQGRLLTQLALQLLTLTFLRPGELRGAHWEEIDLDAALWRIPMSRMKMRTEHLVPLSTQAIALINEVKRITGQYDLLFPSERKRSEPMSDNTMRRAMFKLGYDGETEGKSRATPHGFRANASSILNEQGFNADAVERQLSHMERNGVRAAYIHHARFMDERKTMMQWWADYLDEEAAKAARLKNQPAGSSK